MLVRHASILAATLLLAACGGGSTPPSPSSTAVRSGAFEQGLKGPVVMALDNETGRLEYWPLRGEPNERRHFITRRLAVRGDGMAGNGDVLSIASYSPPELVTYDLDTKTTTSMADPFSYPLDVAIDTNGTRYVLDTAGVTVYKAGSQQAYQLSCNLLSFATAVAVDNEGDVFVNGYGNDYEVFEYPAGSSQCLKLPIREQGYANGIGVDPKTDDLIVVDQIGCAGGKTE